MNRYVRSVRASLPEGLDVAIAPGKTHVYRVVHADTREPLRTERGMPVVIASSPSDYRSIRNLKAQVRTALAHHRRHF